MKLLLRLMVLFSLIKKFNFSLPYANDKSFKIPIINSLGYTHFFDHESGLFALLKRLVKSPMEGCFIDVGVNIGQTLLKVKSIDRTIQYIGFEPNPHCLYYLTELLSCNNFHDVTIFPVALSIQIGITDLNFFSNDQIDSSASIVPGFRKRKPLRKIKIPVMDSSNVQLFESTKAVIIKIDVEGGELEVIRSLLQLIQRDRPIIICEILPIYNVENSFRIKRQEEVENIFKGLQYKTAVIDNLGALKEIGSIGLHADINRVNYLFFPEEESKQVFSL